MVFVFMFFTVEQCAKLSSTGKTCKVTPITKRKKRREIWVVNIRAKKQGAKLEVTEDPDSVIIDLIN